MRDPLGAGDDVTERLDRIEARLDSLHERLTNLKTGGGGIGCLGFGLFVVVLMKLSEILDLLAK
jgi:hypothetical protein